jgi:hypothetical protein
MLFSLTVSMGGTVISISSECIWQNPLMTPLGSCPNFAGDPRRLGLKIDMILWTIQTEEVWSKLFKLAVCFT